MRIRRLPRRGRPAQVYRKRLALRLMTVLLLGCFLFLFFALRLRPIIRTYAESRAVYLATSTINEAVNQEIAQSGLTYLDLIDLEKDNEGHITALKTNIVKINQLKASVTNHVIERLREMDTSGISIPLGTISGVDFLTGLGPSLQVKIVPLGQASASFGSRFSSAGINQTRHSIVMEIAVTITVILPGERIETEVKTGLDVAETVIVGVVPDSYTNVEDPTDQTTELIFDYGT